ncbi:F-box domain-containing protein [Colletotrichum graminicola]|uniref:F-box domain-containing protein n=1 Tax=Colletotrichum graminicola (strain M1.001 / M2 / FGSC 10212) TaxID=645133 RepID=E3QTR1_COLGM|nr:F-box domain-containing protein [Colletotrichum graminicola M1.001]EFQ34223.1 F-box domain-containing protein [Colletotrichum graminicola M1.001]WDK12676.1 F-box domain-containing protein [Colletotrichum graminicola]
MAADWNCLPLEIRWMIRDYIKSLQPIATNIANQQLLLVCREWHSWFAHDNYRLLVLDQDRLGDFEKLVSDNEARRNYVQRIVLRIRLPDYGCPACDEEEDDATACSNDEVFIDVLRRFMNIMSAWPKREHNSGITLDLGAYSPSDGRHGFRDYRFSDQYQYGAPYTSHEQHADVLWRAQEAVENQKSTCPGWTRNNNVKCSSPSLPSQKRLLATLGDFRRQHFSKVFTEGHRDTPPHPILKGIPSAPAITSLVLPRHYYRPISLLVIGCLIRQGFPSLQSFRRETWRAFGIPAGQSMGGYQSLFAALPTTIDHFSLLCELKDTHVGLPITLSRFYQPRFGGIYMGIAAAMLVRRLRSFCATYTVSFEDFVGGDLLRGRPVHPRLEHLVMTSDLLNTRVSCRATRFFGLIYMAGRFAFVSMPNLKSLIVWDGDKRDGFLMRFTYTYLNSSGPEQGRRQPTVDCCGTRYARKDLLPVFAKLRHVLGLLLPPGTPSMRFIFKTSRPAGRREEVEGERELAVGRRIPQEPEFQEVRHLILDPESAKQRLFERRVFEMH